MSFIRPYLDQDDMIAMTRDMVNIASPPGEEGAMADYVASRFAGLGAEVYTQEVESGRYNVVADFPGDIDAPSLLFCAHFDTSIHGREKQQPKDHMALAEVRDGWIMGQGASNMKSAFTSYYQAMSGIQKSGKKLRGRVTVAGVVGETERAEVDEYSGVLFRGNGIGAWHLVSHGVTADMAIIGEPTGLRLTIGHTGYLYCRVSIPGVTQHTWCKEAGIDPLPKAEKVMQALRAWEPKLKALHPHDFMEARLGVGAIAGGYPFKPSKCPAPFCNIYFDLRVPPPVVPAQIRREVWDALKPLMAEDPDLQPSLQFYCANMGYEIERNHAIVSAISQAHQDATGQRLLEASPNRYAVSSDCVSLAQFGIPGINYGPGGVRPSGDYSVYGSGGESVHVDNIATAAETYALAALKICGSVT